MAFTQGPGPFSGFNQPYPGAAMPFGSPHPYYPGVVRVGDRNKLVAALLALLLGSLGIHRFYLGRIGSGIVYLLFSWTMIPALIGIFEFVILLTMNDQAFDLKYNYAPVFMPSL